MTAKQTLLGLLAQDDLKRVLQGLHSLGEQHGNAQIIEDATFQSGRLKALGNKRKTDTISTEDDHLETAKIRQALLATINDLPDDWKAGELEIAHQFLSTKSRINWKKYAAIFVGTVTLLAGIAEFTGYSVRDFFKKEEVKEQPTTHQPPSQNVSTSGDNSPAVITNGGDANFNYNEPKPKEDSTIKKQTPQK